MIDGVGDHGLGDCELVKAVNWSDGLKKEETVEVVEKNGGKGSAAELWSWGWWPAAWIFPAKVKTKTRKRVK